MSPTPTLLALLKSFEANCQQSYCWVGKRPVAANDHQTAHAIARSAGLPSTDSYPLTDDTLLRLDREKAIRILAASGTTSLAYGFHRGPSDEALRATRQALAELSENAMFFSNGPWTSGATTWTPLTDATFDCGVTGFDEQHAFVFWVEDED